MAYAKRGRPRLERPHVDLGTPELIMKRAAGLTEESLDHCHRRGIITDEQHWCGIHLRWLYTLRYGAPSVQAIDWLSISCAPTLTDDPDWRVAREQEYHEAILQLQQERLDKLMLDIIVFNHPVVQMHPDALAQSLSFSLRNESTLLHFQRGLDMLAALWCRKRSK